MGLGGLPACGKIPHQQAGQGVGSNHPRPPVVPPPFLGSRGQCELVRAPMPQKGTTQALSAYIRGVKALS